MEVLTRRWRIWRRVWGKRFLRAPGVEQHALRQRRLAHIDVGDDADVADLGYGVVGTHKNQESANQESVEFSDRPFKQCLNFTQNVSEIRRGGSNHIRFTTIVFVVG